MTTGKLLETAGILLALVSLSFLPAAAQSYSVLHIFNDTPDGAFPESRVMIDPNGNLYGATAGGGKNNQGAIFRVSRAGDETVMYSFGNIPDGNDPGGSLLRDTSGNLYGTTALGGRGPCSSGCGTVFKLPKGGKREVWHTSFLDGDDGAGPTGDLVMDATGNIYGTTESGGGTSCPPYGGCGTVFKVDPNGVESVIYRFAGVPDSAVPIGGLTQDADGNLYGTTYVGGTFNLGTIFKIDSSGTETVLYSFAGPPDGSLPRGTLSIDQAGNLYGTTQAGGTSTLCGGGCGTIFRLDPTGHETVLYVFKGEGDGYFPFGGVIQDTRGNMFGTTYAGSYFKGGNVFAFTHETLKVLHAFSGGADGASPQAGLIQDAAGYLYGTTLGDSCCGTVFKLYPYKNLQEPSGGGVGRNLK